MLSGKIVWKASLIFVAASLLCSCGSSRRDESLTRAQAGPVSVELNNFISAKPGKSRLDVNIRIPLAFFVYVRDLHAGAAAPFAARADISTEIFDHTGVSVARDLLRREIGARDERPSPGPDRFLQVMFTFDLPPGEYTIVTDVSDLESSRRFLDRYRKAVLKDFSTDTLKFSDILFIPSSPAADSGPITPISFGGDLPLGRNAYAYMEFVSPAPADSVRVSYSISRTQSSDRKPSAGSSLSPAPPGPSGFLEPRKSDMGSVYYVTRVPMPRHHAVWFPINGDTLGEGEYELRTVISAGSAPVEHGQSFRVRWIDMPRSLHNLRLAIEALEYIASDSEMHEMRSASPERQRVLFEGFWKPRDSNPATSFNQEMAEYYRRVDFAIENFTTLRGSSGLKTDRGKAYILYGPPASIERDLKPGGDPREIWSYPNLHRRLVFVDTERHGDYKLLVTERI